MQVLAPRGTVYETLFNFTTKSGWSSTGLASMIGIVNPIGVLVGTFVDDNPPNWS
jgi:choline transport protein